LWSRSVSINPSGVLKRKCCPGDKFQEVIQKYPDVASHLFETVVGRLNQANNIIVKLANEQAKKPE